MATRTVEVDRNMLLFPKEKIAASSDLNDLAGKPGTYYVLSDGEAATISNMPRNASGTLIHLKRSIGGYEEQFYFPTTGVPFIYARNYNNGTWTSWALISVGIQNTGTITPESGVTLGEARCVQKGHIVEVHFYATGSFTTSTYLIAKISGVSMPPTAIRYMCGYASHAYDAQKSGNCSLWTDGKISIVLPESAGSVTVDFVYTVD